MIGGLIVARGLSDLWLSYLSFPGSLAPRTRSLFVLAGGLFIIAVIVVKAMSYGILGPSRTVGKSILVIEETMEMLSSAIVAYALTDYVRVQLPAATLEFE
jgi:hypothetical protein